MALIKKYDPKVPGADADKLLKPEELLYLRQVRLELHKMNPLSENTVFQKTLNFFEENGLEEYISNMNGKNKMQVGGSIILASDAKHFKTPKEIYDGQAMGYRNSPFGENAFESKTYYQIRYLTNDYANAKIPVSGISSADFDDFVKRNGGGNVYVATVNSSPFTGNGHVPGAPELLAVDRQTVSEALIVKISPDGTEVPVAVTKVDELDKSIVKFIKIE